MVSGVYHFHREPKALSGGGLRLHRFGATLKAPHEVRPVACPSMAFADSRFSVNCWIYRPRDQP